MIGDNAEKELTVNVTCSEIAVLLYFELELYSETFFRGAATFITSRVSNGGHEGGVICGYLFAISDRPLRNLGHGGDNFVDFGAAAPVREI